jgi:mRNA interferase MazF
MSVPRRGEIWWAESSEFGRRPVVVLTRDPAIAALRRPMVAPCTTTIRGLESEIVLEPGDDPVSEVSAVNLDSVEALPVGLLTERLGVLSSSRMEQICGALAVATGCE